jgi:hypothetical protein
LPERDASGSEVAGQRGAGSSWTEPLPEHDPFAGRGSGTGQVTAEQHGFGQAEHASLAHAQATRQAVAAEPTVTNYPRRVPGTHFDSQRQPETHVAEPTAPPPADPPQAVQQQSVFEDSASNASPMLPGSTQGAPGLPSTPVADASAAPMLPDAVAAPSPVAEPMSDGPATSDITALRSAQMRASRQQKPGRLFGRSLLAFVLIGGVLGAGLYFGRSFLYPTDWDAQLTPIVNELQDVRGVEFEETVPLVAQPPEQYGDELLAAAIGGGWVERVPEWRALGLATGEVTEATVGAALAGSTTAFYDPETRTIYRVDGVALAQADLRLALTAALDHQQSEANTAAAEGTADAEGESGEQVDAADAAAEPVGAAIASPPGFTGVSPLSSIAGGAVDRVLVFGSADAREPASEALPMPIAYEVAAVDILGESIVAAAGVDRATLVPGGPFPSSITTALDDRVVEAAAGLLEPGDTALADPVALGTDDWSLVWGVRLPEITVDTLLTQVVADSYRPIDRGGTVCFIAVFETPDELTGGAVLAAMQSWAVSSPVSAQAVATSLGATRVQLQACDPGVVESAPNIGVVDALIDRQQLRLTN